MRTRDVAKKAVREQIALTALRLFQQNGFEKTTVEEIATMIGMSTRTFFRYFRSKDEVLLEPTQAFRLRFLESFEPGLSSDDLWDALRIAFNESALNCHELEPEKLRAERHAIIQATPALLARQLEMVERLQIDATDLYMSKGSQEKTLSWWTTNAIVRSGFACLHAVQYSFPEDKVQAALQELMDDLRPNVLTAGR